MWHTSSVYFLLAISSTHPYQFACNNVDGVVPGVPASEEEGRLWRINLLDVVAAPPTRAFAAAKFLVDEDETTRRSPLFGALPELSKFFSRFAAVVVPAVDNTPVIHVQFRPAVPAEEPDDVDARIFGCQRLCEATWFAAPPEETSGAADRFLCWWVAFNVSQNDQCYLVPRRGGDTRATSLDVTTVDLKENPKQLRVLSPFRQTARLGAADAQGNNSPAVGGNKYRIFMATRSNLLGQYPVSSSRDSLGFYTTGRVDFSFRFFLFLWPIVMCFLNGTLWWALRLWK